MLPSTNLRGVKDWNKARMTDAPTQFMRAAWKRHALDAAGRVTDSRAYVFAVLDAFRAGLGGPVVTDPKVRFSEAYRSSELD